MFASIKQRSSVAAMALALAAIALFSACAANGDSANTGGGDIGNASSPAVSDNGTSRIAFVSNRDGDFEIYTMASNGSDVRQLTANESDDWNPAWSPDGTRIAFIFGPDGGREIYTMAPDGSDVRQLTDIDGGFYPISVSWSPDGSRLAFESDHDGDNGIYTISSDGSDMRLITNAQFIRDTEFAHNNQFSNPLVYLYPSWSPDGSRIAFSSNLGGAYHIYIAPLDESELRRLSQDNSFDSSWSPDGSRIAFSSNRLQRLNFQIHTDIVEPELVGDFYVGNLTDNPDAYINNEGDRYPSWSPDSSRIAFASDRDGDFEIYTMSSDGFDVRRLTYNSAIDMQPDWSPVLP